MPAPPSRFTRAGLHVSFAPPGVGPARPAVAAAATTERAFAQP